MQLHRFRSLDLAIAGDRPSVGLRLPVSESRSGKVARLIRPLEGSATKKITSSVKKCPI